MKINNNNKIVLLIDGHYLMFRSWFGIPNPMINNNGIEVRAIYGFIVLGLGYLVTETLGIDFDIKVILLPIALFLLTKRVLRYKKS